MRLSEVLWPVIGHDLPQDVFRRLDATFDVVGEPETWADETQRRMQFLIHVFDGLDAAYYHRDRIGVPPVSRTPVALGAMLGLGSFIVGVGLIGDVALLIALLGPPLAVWLIYKLRGFQLVVMSVVGIGTALAVVLLAAGGYNT